MVSLKSISQILSNFRSDMHTHFRHSDRSFYIFDNYALYENVSDNSNDKLARHRNFINSIIASTSLLFSGKTSHLDVKQVVKMFCNFFKGS